MNYYIRQSEHIQEDLKRGWSSWNFGEDGFFGTEEELENYLDGCKGNTPAMISGFEIFEDQQSEFEFGELHPGYWVVKDQDFSDSLACNKMESSTLQEAISDALKNGVGSCPDGVSLPENAKLVWSSKDLHIFEAE